MPHVPKLETLGTIIGSRRYLGQCFLCGRQFMSLYARVARHESGRLICEGCARTKVPDATRS